MRPKGRRAAFVAVSLAAVSAVGGGVLARTHASDDGALQPTRGPADPAIEKKVSSLVKRMTLDEKLEQIQLLADNQVTPDDARKGVGGVFSLTDPAKINQLQHEAVDLSRLHIP